MPLGVLYMQPFLLIVAKLMAITVRSGLIYLHQRGAFDVARFDEQGNARAFIP